MGITLKGGNAESLYAPARQKRNTCQVVVVVCLYCDGYASLGHLHCAHKRFSSSSLETVGFCCIPVYMNHATWLCGLECCLNALTIIQFREMANIWSCWRRGDCLQESCTQNHWCYILIQLDSIASQRCLSDIAHTDPNLSDKEDVHQMSMIIGGSTS